MGLFMAETAAPGDRVAKYSGTPLSAEEAKSTHSAYKLKVHSNLVLDAQSTDEFTGRYVNDGPKAGKAVNARFGSKRTIYVHVPNDWQTMDFYLRN